jgi:hypothetical protein
MIEGCRIGIEIGGGVQCSNFTVTNSVFAAAPGQDSTCIRLSGEGETLELKRMMINNVVFEGFSKGLQADQEILTGDSVRVVNSDLNNAASKR